MHFSSIADAFPSALNRLYQAREDALRRGQPIVDLVSGNVNKAGIYYPQEVLAEALVQALRASRVYDPDSFGQIAARQAISGYYRQAGVNLPFEQMVLTPGSSVSYLYCFKLLADSGDEILCPSPSYPLFETIAKLCQIRPTAYRLVESEGWKIDLDYLESQITTRTRAIVVISPHNPTGAVADDDELQGLAEIAAGHQLPIVADEVFGEFLFGLHRLPRAAQTDAPLVFTLNGFSKMLALPGIKLGWLAVSGKPSFVKKSIRALEMISDTFLPVSEPVQFAVPELLNSGQSFLTSYRSWVSQCRDLAVKALSSCRNLALVAPSGGFYLTARWVGSERDEEQWIIKLLSEHGVLVHPGYFYDIPETHLVMNFVQEHGALKQALRRLAEFLGRDVL
jgi:alanine-synthesizing transaminase